MSSREHLSLLRDILAASPDEDYLHADGDREQSSATIENVLPTLAKLQQPSLQNEYVTAVQLLADAARDERWRTPYGDHGILKYVLDRWTVPGPPALSKQILRLWGNSCIDNDENRQVAASYGFDKLAQAFRTPDLAGLDPDVAVNALYNTCLDCEPAQQRAVQLQMHDLLARLLAGAFQKQGSSIFELIALLTARAREVDPGSLHFETLEALLSAAHGRCGPHIDSSHLLTAVMTYVVANPSLWSVDNTLKIARDALQLLYLNVLHVTDWPDTNEDEEEEENQQTAATLLRDAISALVESYDVAASQDSSLSQTFFLPWLSSSNELLQETACLILGNLALKFPQLAVNYVNKDLHKAAFNLMQSVAGFAPKHAAAGFLTAMALPRDNKGPFMETDAAGSSIIWLAVSTLLGEKDFSLIKDAFTLFSGFVRDSAEACRFMLLQTADTTIMAPLSVLTSTCSKMHGSSPFTAEPLSACARGLATMTRLMLQPGMPSIDIHVEAFFHDPWVLYPLVETFRYSEEKGRRLDCTVGLARIACSHPEGAAIIAKAMSSDSSALLEAIKRTCDGDEKEARSNCHVIIESVLRLATADCTPQTLEDLLSIQRRLIA